MSVGGCIVIGECDWPMARDLSDRLILRRAARGWLTQRDGVSLYIGRLLPPYLADTVPAQIQAGHLRLVAPLPARHRL